MKMLASCLLAACLQTAANSYAQGISLHLSRAPLQQAFTDITRQTGQLFLYENDVLQNSLPVTVTIEKATLQEALDACFLHQPLRWRLVNKTVVIFRRMPPSVQKKDSVRTVMGQVFGDGSPLASVSVLINGSGQGTTTDEHGNFTLTITGKNPVTLSFTAIGYGTVSQPANFTSAMHVRLYRTVSELDQTVVIGYGSTTRRLNTGNVSKVNSHTISAQPISNPLAALQGRVAGLYITQQTGTAGGAFTVRLRGQNSIANGNDPLFIVDGVPFLSEPIGANPTSAAITRQGNPLININPADIESIEVLKDADATSIYGSRGANGVILITTKKGKVGPTSLDLQVSRGWGTITNRMDLLSSRQYLDMRYEAFKNDVADPQPWDYDLTQWDTTRYTDWQKELIGGTADILNTQAAVSGGNEQTHFRLGTNYYRETTVFPGDFSDQKISAHTQLYHQTLNRKFQLNISSSFLYDDNRLPGTDLTYQALTLAPIAPELYDDEGKLNWANSTWYLGNPLAMLLQKYRAETSNLISNMTLSYAPVEGLQFKSSFGYTTTQMDEVSTLPASSYDPIYGITSSSSIFARNQIHSWIIEPQAEYRKSFNLLNASFMLGGTFQSQSLENEAVMGTGYSNESLLENKKGAAKISNINSSSILYRYQALFGRLHLDWDKKYLLNITARRDGSSRFGPGKQFANFGAFGAGWIFSKEKWIEKNISFLSFGKIRMSFGTSGNDKTIDYAYMDLYDPTRYAYNGTPGLYPSRIFNPDYAWEINRKFEAGLELGLFNNRLLISSSYWKNRSGNQLVGFPLPPSTGFPSVQYNLPAIVENSGIEMEITAHLLKKKTFGWTCSFNITVPDNRLVAYPGIEKSSYANRYAVGESLNSTKRFTYSGIDPVSGLYLFEDLDKDDNINSPNDIKITKAIEQQFYGGWQHSIQYKKITLDVFFQFVKQTGLVYTSGFDSPPGFAFNQPSTVTDRWQSNGDAGTVQRYTQSFGGVYGTFEQVTTSDYRIGDASFARLKNIMLQYDVTELVKRKIKVKGLQLIFRGQNLLTITGYDGPDPENQSFAYLPPLKVLTAGIQVTF